MYNMLSLVKVYIFCIVIRVYRIYNNIKYKFLNLKKYPKTLNFNLKISYSKISFITRYLNVITVGTCTTLHIIGTLNCCSSIAMSIDCKTNEGFKNPLGYMDFSRKKK